MFDSQSIPLVDVISLSQQNCAVPILGDLKYSYDDNFIGRPIEGYEHNLRDICLLAPNAAKMLCNVQNYLVENFQQGLLIFDAYRPLRATQDFVKWFYEEPTPSEIARKAIHYPHLNKNELSHQGYIAEGVSRHCYGQAVDLTLIDLATNTLLDMGACFDFFNELSHASQTAETIGEIAYQNRTRLKDAMHQFNFQVHANEYWHFDYVHQENQEPLDIVITEQLRGLGVVTETIE